MFSEYDYNDTLCHYGVKGMKWGVRHDKSIKGKKSSPNKQTRYQKAMRKLGKTKFATRAILTSGLSLEQKRQALIDQETMRINDGWYKNGKRKANKSMAEMKMNSIDDRIASGKKEMKKAMDTYGKNYTIIYDVTTGQYSLRKK